MMGLLGNVAEVKWLRPKLMTQEFIEVFARLLDSLSDGIEVGGASASVVARVREREMASANHAYLRFQVSYNAAGVLAHIASDGADAWTIKTPSREHVLERMVAAIQRWNIKSERNINYRSFEPILSLVRCYETPQCQHWAVWALANLTQVGEQFLFPLLVHCVLTSAFRHRFIPKNIASWWSRRTASRSSTS